MERKGRAASATVQAVHRALQKLGRSVSAVVRQLLRWRQLSRDRAELARLSDDHLRDIGLSRAQVLGESSRPFWDDSYKR